MIKILFNDRSDSDYVDFDKKTGNVEHYFELRYDHDIQKFNGDTLTKIKEIIENSHQEKKIIIQNNHYKDFKSKDNYSYSMYQLMELLLGTFPDYSLQIEQVKPENKPIHIENSQQLKAYFEDNSHYQLNLSFLRLHSMINEWFTLVGIKHTFETLSCAEYQYRNLEKNCTLLNELLKYMITNIKDSDVFLYLIMNVAPECIRGFEADIGPEIKALIPMLQIQSGDETREIMNVFEKFWNTKKNYWKIDAFYAPEIWQTMEAFVAKKIKDYIPQERVNSPFNLDI